MQIVSFIAIVFGTVNVIGGFVVTDRMLAMFKTRPASVDSTDDKN